MRSVLVVAVVLSLGGCGDGSEDASAASPPSRAPDLEGEVTSVVAVDGDTEGEVLVEAEPGVEGTEKISFNITSRSMLLRQQGSGLEALTSLDEVVVGLRVRAWAVEGAVAESYPGQANAEAIVVVGA